MSSVTFGGSIAILLAVSSNRRRITSRGAGQCQRQSDDIGKLHRVGVRCGGGCAHEQRLFLEQRNAQQSGPLKNVVRQRDVDLLALERVHQEAAHLLEQVQVDARQRLPRADHHVAADQRHHAGGHAEHDAFALLPACGHDLALGFIDLPEDFAGPFVEDASGLGRRDAARMAAEQRHVQVLLELPDLQAQRRLRNEELLRGAGDVAGLYGTREIAELAQVDWIVLPLQPAKI